MAGYRLVRPGKSEIYLVDPEGFRRRIPNHTVYSRLFRSWHGIIDVHDLDAIAEGVAFAVDTRLVRGDDSYAIYIVDDGRKRALASKAVMDKYWFDWSGVALVPQLLIDPMPTGELWE
jgi:hypothetical protein